MPRIESPFQATKLRDIAPGTFFKALGRDRQFFGLAITDEDGGKGALVFEQNHNESGMPWLLNSGMGNYTIAAMADAIIRPDIDAAGPSWESLPFGDLISTNSGTFIKASCGIGYSQIFNVDTGAVGQLLDSYSPLFVYPRWAIGYQMDGNFKEIFSFPPSPLQPQQS